MRPILSTAAFLVSAVILTVGCHRPTPPPPDSGPVAVTVATPIQKLVTQYTDLTGNLAAVESVDVRPRVSGYIEKVYFTDGADVQAGQLLVKIDPSSYLADMKRAEGELRNWKAQLKLADADYTRFDKLRKTGAISQEEFDKSSAQVDVAKAKIFAAEADLERARLNVQWTDVTAPISGRVDRIYLTAGNVATGGLSQGTILTTIVSETPVYAYLTVDEQQVLAYLNRQSVKWNPATVVGCLPVVAQEFLKPVDVEIGLVSEEGFPHHGTFDFASNRLDPSTGTLQLRAILDNPGPVRKLVPGMYVKARIPAKQPTHALLIPDEAVVSDQANKAVYVVNAENKVEMRQVRLGFRSAGLRVVESGLQPDDRIIIRGLQRVTPGQPVDPQPGTIRIPH
ncbi:MAG: efflux RND transporter periplasmic adaptor subunit [Bacteroidales bacterium]|nr:efflux RND transporter periplasmic adaptor subunit [Bacteroidales bacterium]